MPQDTPAGVSDDTSGALRDPDRLAALETEPFDEIAEERIDHYGRIVCHQLGVPVSTVSAIYSDRHLFKSCVGLTEAEAPDREMPLSDSICKHVVIDEQPLVIEDARAHPLIDGDNVLVNEYEVVAYLGVPLRTPEGYALGSFCAIDNEPRSWSAEDVAFMEAMSEAVMAEIQSKRFADEEYARLDPEALLEPVVEGAFDGVMVLEPAYASASEGGEEPAEREVKDFVCRLVNERAARLLGASEKELVGARMLEHFALSEEESHFEDYLRVMETGEPYHETAYYDRENLQGWFEVTIVPWERGIVVSFQEVTKYKETQEQLEKVYEQRRLALEAAQLGTWDFDFEEGTVYWDDRCRAIFGVSQDEKIEYDKVIGLMHPDDQERVDQGVTRTLEYTGSKTNDYEEEYRIIWPDGTVRWVVANGQAHFEETDDEPRAVRFIGVVRDVTQQKEAEEALRESETVKGGIFESALDCIITIDQESRVLEFNPAAERTFGYSREEIIGEPMHEYIVPPHLREAHLEGMERYLETGEGRMLDQRVEITAQHADGTEFPIELAIVPIELEQEERFIAYLRDITERKQYERDLKEAKEKAQAANQAKSQFLANMNHELRTPLNAVIGYSELLKEDMIEEGVLSESLEAEGKTGISNEQEKKFLTDLDKIHAAGEQLLELVNDVLDITKIEAGELELHPTTFEIGSMAVDAAETIRSLVEEKGNRFTVECPEDLGTMYSDKTKVRQVLFNLLSNAAKFTENGEVTLRLQRTSEQSHSDAQSRGQDDWVYLTVEDTGIGMAEEEQANIFGTFAQADTSLTRQYEGTGLGLTISQNLCQLMGGDLVVESEKGVGSTFTARLPVEMESHGRASELTKEEAAPAARSGPEHEKPMTEFDFAPDEDVVLVIDDEASVRELIKERLENEGFAVVTASSGEAGLEAARELQPTAITLDVTMPEMDGWAVLSALKDDERLKDIPVVMVTIAHDEDMGYMLGASDYLTKPLDVDRLAHVLEKYRTDEGCSVMLVEDDESTRDLLRRTLEKKGCAVHEAKDGREGLEMLAGTESSNGYRPNVIVLDLMMPHVDGFAFMERMRQREDLSQIPVVVVTAKDLTAEERRRLNGGVISVLQKGDYDRDALLDKVQHAVNAASR